MSSHISNLARYMHYCSKIESPDVYIEFSFYSLIASCLQRRIWVSDTDFEVFPNLYIIFVGPPATGKSVAARINVKILEKLKRPNPARPLELQDIVPVAPDTTSLQALTARMAQVDNQRTFYPESGLLKVQSPLTFISEELGNLFQTNTQDLITFLCQGYDNGDYKKELKYGGNDYIKRMCINLLAATNPGWMAKATHFGLIEMGLASRGIFIAGGGLRFRNAFYDVDKDQQDCFSYLIKYCLELTKICGQCHFSPEARDFIQHWWKNHRPTNPDKKLEHYYGRKKLHVMKLAIINHFADNLGGENTKQIEIESVNKSLSALARVEINMHEAFNSANINPIHTMALNIMHLIKHRGGRLPTKKVTLLFHEDEQRPGDINAALEWLISTYQLKVEIDNKEGNILVITD